jgi:hypothetical protein
VRKGAEDEKAKPGTGGRTKLAGRAGQPCKRKERPIPSVALEVKRTGFGRKCDDVTQGDLILSAKR